MKKKHALVITNSFDPGGAKQRGRKIADRVQICQKYGWNIVILIPEKQEMDNYVREFQICYAKEPYLLKLIKSFVTESSNNFKRNFSSSDNSLRRRISLYWKKIAKQSLTFLAFPDSFSSWIIPMYKKAKKVIQDKDIHAVCTMCYPFSLHIVGLLLKKSTGIPWLAEFQDAWVKNPNHFNGEANIFHKILERKVIEASDKVVTNEGVQLPPDYFHETYPSFSKHKFETLPAPGFDGFYFNKYQRMEPVDFHKFSITYAGNFYGKGLNPVNFLRGLKVFVNDQNLGNKDMIVNFLGDWDTKYTKLINRLNLHSIVKIHGQVPYTTCLSYLKGADVLLLLIRRYQGDELNIPSKVSDYIAAKKPILALAEKTWKSAKYIKDNELGIVADPEDPDQIAEALKELYKAYKGKDIPFFTPTGDLFKRIDSMNIMKSYCSFLDEITRNG